MSKITPDSIPGNAFFDVLYNELAQPLAVITTLAELWQLGMSEPGDATMLKHEIDRLIVIMRELRAQCDASQFSPRFSSTDGTSNLSELVMALSYPLNLVA